MASEERLLVAFTVSSEPGNERLALARVADAVNATSNRSSEAIVTTIPRLAPRTG